MIDREARNRLAEATRHYLTRHSTNFEFDVAAFDLKSDDLGVICTRDNLWLIYDDLQEHKHEKKWTLSDEHRQIVLRIILFLKSDTEYSWPVIPYWYRLVRPIIWLFSIGRVTKHLDARFRFKDEMNIWPFSSAEEMEIARMEPKYLANAT